MTNEEILATRPSQLIDELEEVAGECSMVTIQMDEVYRLTDYVRLLEWKNSRMATKLELLAKIRALRRHLRMTTNLDCSKNSSLDNLTPDQLRRVDAMLAEGLEVSGE